MEKWPTSQYFFHPNNNTLWKCRAARSLLLEQIFVYYSKQRQTPATQILPPEFVRWKSWNRRARSAGLGVRRCGRRNFRARCNLAVPIPNFDIADRQSGQPELARADRDGRRIAKYRV